MEDSAESFVDTVRALAVETARGQSALSAAHDQAWTRFHGALAAAKVRFDDPMVRELAAVVGPTRVELRRASIDAELVVRLETQWGVRVGLDLTLADPRDVRSALTLGRRDEQDRGLTLFAYERRGQEARGSAHRLTLELAVEDELLAEEGTSSHGQ